MRTSSIATWRMISRAPCSPASECAITQRGLGIDREVGGVEDDADRLGLARLLGGPEGQDRTRGTAQNGDGHASGQQPPQTRAPVRPHHDQVAAELPWPFAGSLLRRRPRSSEYSTSMGRSGSVDLAHFLLELLR